MKIQRTLPPAAPSFTFKDLLSGVFNLLGSEKSWQDIHKEIKNYFGVRHVFFVSSGKAALALILTSLKEIAGKDKVIIPAYTCFSVPSAIAHAGLEVVLCDIDPYTLDFDFDHLREIVDHDTLCVVPQHFFGLVANVDRVKRYCNAQEVFVVEDAAQAMGGDNRGVKLGTIGDVGFFSLGRGKQLTCGSGGIIVTNSDVIATAVSRHYTTLVEQSVVDVLREFFQLILMSIFIRPSLYWLPSGLPFLGLGETVFDPYFPVKKFSRRKVGLLQGWHNQMEGGRRVRVASATHFLKRLWPDKVQTVPPYLRFPILAPSQIVRDTFFAMSQAKGLGVSRMYPTAVSDIAELQPSFRGQTFPAARYVAERLLTLPTHHWLSDNDKEALCTLLQNFKEANMVPICPPGGKHSCST